nr:zinc finger protein 845-like [Cherax quadricarinatus]XP_053641577.1 zinc finger protein 845-like [Cherax quadricarinatus]
MSSKLDHDCCFVCSRTVDKGRGVKGTARLRHTGTQVSKVIGDIIKQTVSFSKLCFRCYRLTLGIDYHKRELKTLKELFFKLYNDKLNISSNLLNIDESSETEMVDGGNDRILFITNVSSDERCKEQSEPVLQCSESSSSDHVYYKNVIDNQLENFDFAGKKTEEKYWETENNMQNSPVCGNHHKHFRKFEFEINLEIENNSEPCIQNTNSKCETDESVTEKEDKEISVDHIVHTLPSKRRKIAKKLEEFEYYTDDVRGLDSGLCSSSGKYSSVCESSKLACSKSNISCDLCKRDFPLKREYINHECFKKKEKRNVSYICKGCQSVFAVRRDYIKHIELCYKNMPVKCSFCPVKLSSAAYLPRHMKSFHNDLTALLKGCLCDQCGRSFSRKEALERHQACVHGLSHGTHQCPQCGYTFPHTSLLAEHLRAHKGYPCTECNKTFSCMSNLTLHKRTHHQKKALYHCSSCNKHWRFHASYTYHMRKVHGFAQHKCLKCKLLFSAEDALEKHKNVCVTDLEANMKPCNAKSNKSKKIGDDEDKSINRTEGVTRTKPTVAASFKEEELQDTVLPKITSVHCKLDNDKTSQASLNSSARIELVPADFTSRCVNILNRKIEQPNIETVASCISNFYNEQQSFVKSKDTLVFVPPVVELKETKVMYQVSAQESSMPSGEIILETLDDLGADCQYVILVEDGSGLTSK